MPKVKNHIIQNKKDYLYVAIGIFVIIFCILLIGRVGIAGKTLALFFSFIFGDFSTIILAFALVYSLCFVLFKKKIDFHHISFVGFVLIMLSLFIFAHLGLYNPLGMTNTTVLSKTFELYGHYLKSYQINFSCGGGIIGAVLLQVTCILVSRIGSILIGIALLIIGISYCAHVPFFKLFKGGKILKLPKILYEKSSAYFKNIHYPTTKPTPVKKISINSLEDTETQVQFTLQNELNKEKFENLKRFIRDKKLYCVADSFYTSYSSSRVVIKMPHRDEEVLKQLIGFFNRQCFFIQAEGLYYLDYPNQFRKLLTLKSLLVQQMESSLIPLGVDVDGKAIGIDIRLGKLLVVVGEQSSGIKTFIRGFILSILIKNIPYSDIYFYDFNNDFAILNNKNFRYVNNEKSAEIALDEAFNEYERRSEVLKYFNCDTIEEANAQIQKSNSEMEPLYPEFHILAFNLSEVSANLLQKISYAIHFSIRVGITIVLVARGKKDLTQIDLNKSDLICFNMSDVSTSLKLFGTDMACRLQKKGDVIIRKDGTISHGQTAYVSTSDFDKIIVK